MGKFNIFDKDSGAYLKTTENINGYYNYLNFYQKKVLTVIGSSDHVFEAISRGAKQVDGFDISNNAILFYYLKEAAIKSLNYENYINFFYIENMKFTKKGYNIIRKNLNEKVLPIWDKIFESNNPYDLISDMLIARPIYYLSIPSATDGLSILSSYLKERLYYRMQSKIANCDINIKLMDVCDVEKINGLYDYIIFSNIFEYQDISSFKKIIEKYREHLSDNGVIVAGYAYHDVDISSFSEFNKIEIPSIGLLKGFYDSPSDKVLTIKKKKL